MKVIRKRPGLMPEVIDLPNDGDAITEEVGGWLKTAQIAPDVVMIFNKGEDGRGGSAWGFHNTYLVAGFDGEQFEDIPRLDEVLHMMFGVVRYTRADRGHNVWRCRGCGLMERFEADGPWENGWNHCPGCGHRILAPSGVEVRV